MSGKAIHLFNRPAEDHQARQRTVYPSFELLKRVAKSGLCQLKIDRSEGGMTVTAV